MVGLHNSKNKMGKKEKKSKTKSVSFPVKTFSAMFSNLYNSEKYSDVIIKTEKGTSFFSHKFVLSSSSNYTFH
jgi:hypothetical protein